MTQIHADVFKGITGCDPSRVVEKCGLNVYPGSLDPGDPTTPNIITTP